MSANASNKSLKLISVLLTVWVTLSLTQDLPLNPGVIVKHTNKYLKLKQEELLCGDSLKQKLKNTPLPDVAGNVSAMLWSNIYYNCKNIVLIDYKKPKVEVSIEPHSSITLNVFLENITFGGECVLELEDRLWKSLNASGSFSISITEAQMTMSQEVVISKEDKEKVKYISHNCTAAIKDVSLESNEPSHKYLGGRIYHHDLKELLGGFLCKLFIKLTEMKVNFTQDRVNDIYLDMAVLNQPTTRDSCVIFENRGEMRHKMDTTPYKYWPEPIPPQDPEKMLICGISRWTMNSVGRVIYNNKLFNYNYTKDDLESGLKHLLDTTCEGDCFGTLFPNASKLYPNTIVDVTVSMVKEPHTFVASSMIKAHLYFNFKASVKTPKHSSELLFDVNMDLCTIVHGVAKGNKIIFELEPPLNSNITVLDSNIGDLSEEPLLTLVAKVFGKIVIPYFIRIKTDGLKITSALNLVVTNHTWKLTDEVVWLMMDLKK